MTSEGSRDESPCPLPLGLVPVLTFKFGHDPGSQWNWGTLPSPLHCPNVTVPPRTLLVLEVDRLLHFVSDAAVTFGCCHCCVSLCVGTLVKLDHVSRNQRGAREASKEN